MQKQSESMQLVGQRTTPLTALPRLGQISFINNLPVVLPIERGTVPVEARTTYANPAELNAAYAAGALDLGAMSSFFYLQNPEFKLVETVSISCLGEVGSVLFFSKRKPAELHNARLAVPSSSATSINLLRVLLLEQYGASVSLDVLAKPDINAPGCDGAMVIGDNALRVDSEWSTRFERIDLGQWWQSTTGLPMVFGVWAAADPWHRQNPGSFHSIASALREAASIGLSSLFDQVLALASERTGLGLPVLKRYYTEQLNYEMTARHTAGLEKYRQLCLKHGLL